MKEKGDPMRLAGVIAKSSDFGEGYLFSETTGED